MQAVSLAGVPTARRATDFPGAERDPLNYPGTRPPYSYLFVDGVVVPLSLQGEIDLDVGDELLPLDPLLDDLASPRCEERIGVLAIGSNACPGRLAEKFATATDSAIPVLHGTIQAADSVYLACLADYAAIPATYIPSQARTELEVWLTLLSTDQFEQMNATEHLGDGYSLVLHPGAFACGRFEFGPVHAYMDHAILGWEGGPIRLDALKAKGSEFSAMNQREILTRVLDYIGFDPQSPLEQRNRMLRADVALRDAVSTDIGTRLRFHGRQPFWRAIGIAPANANRIQWRPR